MWTVWISRVDLDMHTADAPDLDRLMRECFGLLDPQVVTAFRTAVLEPGGSSDGDELVNRFLGKPGGIREISPCAVGPQHPSNGMNHAATLTVGPIDIAAHGTAVHQDLCGRRN
jgi:hypothetical protein